VVGRRHHLDLVGTSLIAIADAFATCQLGQRTDAATNQGVEAAAGSLDFREQHRIGIGRSRVACIDGEPYLHPARVIRSRNSRVRAPVIQVGGEWDIQQGSGFRVHV
jgi:hypothetical protein